MKYELIDHGPEHSQYFQGCGTTFTDFDEVSTGIGNDPREALDDALDSIAQQTSSGFVAELERRILEDFPAFDDPETIAANTVDRGEKEIEAIEVLIEQLEEQISENTDDGMTVVLADELDEARQSLDEATAAMEDSELHYHISIRYCHAENLDGLSTDPKDYDAYAANEDNELILRDYAAVKATAMRHRLAGRIETALQIERLLESIYNTLPPHLKW